MNKTEKYLSSAIVAIVRAKSHGEGRELAIALLAAGVTTLEVTSTTPGYLEIISEFADRKDIAIGMGTVLKKSHVKDACAAGAKFIVSPDTSEEVIKLTKKKGLISIPGVATASDVGRAIRFGADALKLFPASSYGPMHLKALSDPFPNQSWIATGGVKSTDVKSWFEVGTTAFGLGGPLTSGGVDEVADRFAIFTTAIREARGDK
jgi:2-dehydro-3-deoxyphosphogluconate aldolase/(4S)-4-hydroxy-2-oxoglutarate aldolase